jgi:hypothetical protein
VGVGDELGETEGDAVGVGDGTGEPVGDGGGVGDAAGDGDAVGVAGGLTLALGLADSAGDAGGSGNITGEDGAEAGPRQDPFVGTTEYMTFCCAGGESWQIRFGATTVQTLTTVVLPSVCRLTR